MGNCASNCKRTFVIESNIPSNFFENKKEIKSDKNEKDSDCFRVLYFIILIYK